MVEKNFIFVEINSRFLGKCVTEENMITKGANNGTLATRVLIRETHGRASSINFFS